MNPLSTPLVCVGVGVIQVCVPVSTNTRGFVGWELSSGREHQELCSHQCQPLFCWVVMVGTSPRPISTGRLGIAAVHLRPINPMVCGGPYPIISVGNLILKRASRLDAFSGYHFRT